MSRAFFRALREAALSPRPDGQGESGRPFPARAARRAAQAGKERKRFFRRPMNWAMEKSILAAYTPPLRNKVREPAGSPTPFGVGLPGLRLCRGQVRLPGECRLGKGFALPLAPIPVGQPAGFPTPFGRAYPVLAGAVDWSGRIPSAVRRVSTANLEVERFVEKAKWLFRKISRPEHRSSLKSWFGAETGEGLCPSPCPYPKATPQSGSTPDSSPTGEP